MCAASLCDMKRNVQINAILTNMHSNNVELPTMKSNSVIAINAALVI